MPTPSLRRRSLLAGAAATCALPALAQPARGAAAPVAVAQIHDSSPEAQDVSKDFLTGARAAWMDINVRGGLGGRPVQHVAIEVDGSPAAVQQAWRALRGQPSCVALSGTVGDAAASALTRVLREDDTSVAHAAPWLQNSSLDPDDRTFPIFSGRQEQITHALKSLTLSGVQEVGAVFASAREAAAYRQDVDRAVAAQKLKLKAWTPTSGLAALGEHLGPGTPALLLFIGGTPELMEFTRGLERQSRQRYVIALADVNLQTVQQMGGGRTTSVIATQAVPLATAALPIVRRYRQALARFFDEPPAALSLAGFIAAQYTFQVLNGIEGPVTRATALAAFQRRQDLDLGGYRVSFRGERRSAGFVTQSMLTADGRVIG